MTEELCEHCKLLREKALDAIIPQTLTHSVHITYKVCRDCMKRLHAKAQIQEPAAPSWTIQEKKR